MKVVMLYRPKSAEARVVEEYVNEFSTRHPEVAIETSNIDSVDGGNLATLYDIVKYPAILVIQSDGSLSKVWQDDQLPIIDEVMSYVMA